MHRHRKSTTSRWEKLLLGLVILLGVIMLIVAFSVFTMYFIPDPRNSRRGGKQHSQQDDESQHHARTPPPPEYAPETAEEAAARREKVQKLLGHLNKHQLQEEAKTEHHQEHAAADGGGGNGGGGAGEEHHHHENAAADNGPEGLLVDAERSVPIDELSQAKSRTAWKVSCVGKKGHRTSGGMNSGKRRVGGGVRSDDGTCFMNLELIDARDGNVDDHLASFHTNIGHGIKRPHRPVPDDSLVPLFLEPQPVKMDVVASADSSAGAEKSTLVSARGGHNNLFVEHHAAGHNSNINHGEKPRAAPSFRWVSPTHRSVSIAVHSSLTDGGGAAAQDNPPTRTTFSFHGVNNAAGRGARFFGAGNRGASMELPKEKEIKLENLDINHYQLDATISLYGSVPLVYAALRVPPSNNNNNNNKRSENDPRKHQSMDRTLFVGILFLNAARLHLRATSHGGEGDSPSLSVAADGGGTRIFFLHGPTPSHVLRQYYQLTGPSLFVPLWSLGYHQCRWTYNDQDDVVNRVHKGFLEHKMPADAIWLDIDHTDHMRYFTFDSNKFPDPAGMQRQLYEEGGRRLVAINDPHIKRDDGFSVYSQGKAAGFFVTRGRNSKSVFDGWCWPGTSVWVDFLREDAREWYASLFRYGSYPGSTKTLFTWTDMNEPSLLGPTLPMDAGLIGGSVLFRDIQNSYGFYNDIAAHKGLVERDLHISDKELEENRGKGGKGTRRPFILTRSFFAGSHRVASVWTGDNQGKFEHLAGSFDMVLMLAMSGIQHSGADIGGFFDSVSDQLFGAWFAASVAYPFQRSHSHHDVRRREPWLQNDNGRVTRALQTRYRIVSHLYSLFARNYFYGDAVVQPLFFAFPDLATSAAADRREYDAANSAEFFFWGTGLLFRPFVKESETAQDYNSRGGGDAAAAVDVCSSAPYLWSDSAHNGGAFSLPSFVSLCTLEWVNPSADGGRSCKISPVSCETPMWQRAGTIVLFNALTSSIKFNNAAKLDDAERRHEATFSAGVPPSFPRSTMDTASAHSPLEVRIAFHLEADGRDGDILAHGTHFNDDGESDWDEESATSKFCLASWTMHQTGEDGLSLCTSQTPEERRALSDTVLGELPTSQPTACFEELQRIRRFIFSVHVEDGKAANKNKALNVAVARPRSFHGGAGDGGKEENMRSSRIIREDSGAHGQTWVVPWTRDKWERLAAVNSQYCVELKPV